MAYDEDLAARIREVITETHEVTEQRMFGGLAFLIGGNMALAASGEGTLVINGEYDHSLKAGRRTARQIPGAVHRILPGTGHACCLEQPAGFDAFVIDFLKDLGRMSPLP